MNISYASDTLYVWSTETKPLNETQTTNANLNTSLVNTQSTDLALQSGGAVLIEQHLGKVLYNHNMHEKLRPASVTKVMTLLLIMGANRFWQIKLYR